MILSSFIVFQFHVISPASPTCQRFNERYSGSACCLCILSCDVSSFCVLLFGVFKSNRRSTTIKASQPPYLVQHRKGHRGQQCSKLAVRVLPVQHISITPPQFFPHIANPACCLHPLHVNLLIAKVCQLPCCPHFRIQRCIT